MKKLVHMLLSAAMHMHSSGFVHRDIKLENCLIDKTLNLYLIDFGLANEFAKPYT